MVEDIETKEEKEKKKMLINKKIMNLYLLFLEDKNLLENIEILRNLKKKLSVKEKNFMT